MIVVSRRTHLGHGIYTYLPSEQALIDYVIRRETNWFHICLNRARTTEEQLKCDREYFESILKSLKEYGFKVIRIDEEEFRIDIKSRGIVYSILPSPRDFEPIVHPIVHVEVAKQPDVLESKLTDIYLELERKILEAVKRADVDLYFDARELFESGFVELMWKVENGVAYPVEIRYSTSLHDLCWGEADYRECVEKHRELIKKLSEIIEECRKEGTCIVKVH